MAPEMAPELSGVLERKGNGAWKVWATLTEGRTAEMEKDSEQQNKKRPGRDSYTGPLGLLNLD